MTEAGHCPGKDWGGKLNFEGQKIGHAFRKQSIFEFKVMKIF